MVETVKAGVRYGRFPVQYTKNSSTQPTQLRIITGRHAKELKIMDYQNDVLPSNKTEEQRLRTLGDLLKAMKTDELIKTDGLNRFLK